MHRLTRSEYLGTVAAALGEDVVREIDPSRLPPDGWVGPFHTNAFISADTSVIWAYRDVAERASTLAATRSECWDRTCAESYLHRVSAVLFREELSEARSSAYLALFDAESEATTGMEQMISALLQSPSFLYRTEIGRPARQARTVKLTGREMATRLAYLLWRRPPDDVLMQAADDGELDSALGVGRHARRMLADERSSAMVRDFFTGYLGLGKPPVEDSLHRDMWVETQTFAAELFLRGGTLDELFTADYSFGSDELAAFYGVPSGVPDDVGLPRIRLNENERSGILTHASVVRAHTAELSNAAVHRGAFLREHVFCELVPPPPPVDTIITPDPTLSPRQRLEQKTEVPGCIVCHRSMNPLGFLFEHYDAEGAYRTRIETFAVDSYGSAPGTDIPGPMADVIEFSEYLAESEQVQDCFVRQWLRFATGRGETPQDATSIARARDALVRANGQMTSLVVALASSPSFRYRATPP